MPKNSNQASPLDKLAEEMEQQEQQEQQAQQAQMQQAQEAQKAPEQAESSTVDDEYANYKPDDSEKGYYHVLLERPYYNKKTGNKLSVPTIQKFTENEYKALTGKKNEKDKSNAELLGYTVRVIWNPKENI